MIISDEDDAQRVKDPPVVVPTVRYPERAATRPFSPLPDYETSQALTLHDLDGSQATLYKPPPRRILDSRIWRAGIISLVVYIFLTLVIGVPIIVHKQHPNSQKYPYTAPNYALTKGFGPGVSNPFQVGVFPVCNNWTEVVFFNGSDLTVFAATEQYVSPNGQFTLTSNASSSNDLDHVQGAFYVGINPNDTIHHAVLSVAMQSSSPSVFNQTFVCLAAADNFTDLALYVPDELNSTDNIKWNITLLFPQTSIASQVDHFSTLLPMFDQQFGMFDDFVVFGKVAIEGSISRVTANSMRAQQLLVDTSLEPITGTFHANSSLFISTVLAPINVNISLYNDPNCPFPTILDVHTGGSDLNANITVLAPNKNPPLRPNFVANLRTFSGSLCANVSHDPTSSPAAIQLRAVNDLGPANLTLDNLFEGPFRASTRQANASVIQGDKRVPDPWVPGLERNMVVELNSSMRICGWIGWGEEDEPWSAVQQQGEVLVDSSLDNVMLSFQG